MDHQHSNNGDLYISNRILNIEYKEVWDHYHKFPPYLLHPVHPGVSIGQIIVNPPLTAAESKT